MSIIAEKKQQLIDEFKIHSEDTGSIEVQCAILTERINNLTKHFQSNPKDFHSNRGLLKLVSKRRNHLKYLERKDKERYSALIKRLGLRK